MIQRISSILLYLLLLLLPVQLGHFFFFNFSYISGVKIDYLAPVLYLSDIIAIVLIAINIRTLYQHTHKSFVIFILLMFLHIAIAQSPYILLFRIIKMVEIAALSIIAQNLKFEYKKILYILIGMGFLQLLLALLQMTQGSAMQGIWYFLGERSFDISSASIAKVSVNGLEILRPYGTFSHPNSLAGFYLLVYTFVLFSKKCSLYTLPKYILLGICSMLVFLSFSKVAIMTHVLITTYYALRDIRRACWLCNLSKIAVVFFVGFFFSMGHGDPNTIAKRLYLASSSLHILGQHPLGTGLGNYLYAQSHIPNPYPYHFLEPVHNIFLLSLTELGIPLFLYAVYLLYPYLKRIWEHDTGRALIMAICITGMFDHYWLTLQQNMLLFPLLFGLLKYEDKYDKIERT